MGVQRWRSVLDAQISESSAQSISKLDLEVLTALRIAVYQLRWLTRIPARAAINESVELVKRARKRSAASFVNAVLRKLTATASPSMSAPPTINRDSAETVAASSAHPLWLVERWAQAYGLESAVQICRHNQSVPVTAIRLRHPEAEERLRAEGIELAPGAFLAFARLVRHGDITKTSAFRAGLCVIPDEASQLVAALVGSVVLNERSRILDCCAAPGGKTLAIADHNPAVAITAVELHPQRARLLQKLLLASQSSARISIVAAEAQHLPLSLQFDRILADVPCSGTGTLARNPEIKWRLTLDDLAKLHTRQVAILRSALAQLAPGGRLIYSTCSLEKEENENVVAQVLSETNSFRLLDCRDDLARLKESGELTWPDPTLLASGPYLRTIPGVHPCDGFFAAILERA